MRCRKRAHPAIEHAQNFAKICINDARICCKVFTISTRGAAKFAVSSAKIPIINSQDVGAAPMQFGAVLRAEKPCGRRRDCAIFHPKMREFIANFLRGRRATHQNFGRRGCENILTLQNLCVELLARAMPKTRASSDRTCAKLCQNLHQ